MSLSEASEIGIQGVLYLLSYNSHKQTTQETYLLGFVSLYVVTTSRLLTIISIAVLSCCSFDKTLERLSLIFNGCSTKEDIIFTDEILTSMIQKYTGGEEGVRNLKRCLENIISTLNIYHLTKCDDKEDILDMKIKDFKLPITLKQEHIDALLKITNTDKPPEHMYM